jgi:membrane associated rhomboid family serine protease
VFLRRYPTTLLFGVLTLTLGLLSVLPGQAHHAAIVLAQYHGSDLAEGIAWRLPLSAFLSESAAQFAWTLVMLIVVFAPLERRIGAANLALFTLLTHVVSTVVVDLFAAASGRHEWLNVADYGTSCLIFGAVVGLYVQTRRLVLACLIAICLGADGFLNSAMTVCEHFVAIGFGALVFTMSSGRHSYRSVREVGHAIGIGRGQAV